MSMINDALRRASSTAPNFPDDAGGAVPPPLPPLHGPSETGAHIISPDEGVPPLLQPPAARKSSLPILLLALFLFCLAGAAGVYLWERNHRPVLPKENSRGQTLAGSIDIVVPERKTAPAPAAASTSNASAASTAAVAKVAAPPANVAVPAQTALVAAATAAPVQFPSLRLQSIFFRPSNPSVMINGRTFYVNDQVQGVTVASIDPASVTLVLSGRTNVLTLR